MRANAVRSPSSIPRGVMGPPKGRRGARATRLPAGARIEYKFVTLRADGRVEWEPGPNRVVETPPTGRAVVTQR